MSDRPPSSRLSSRVLMLCSVSALWSCSDNFEGAVARCKADPMLCTGDGAGEAAFGSSACLDGMDNDGDGLIDCADPDCAARTCRASRGDCDEVEACADLACPTDLVAEPGKECRQVAGACDVADLCNGVSPVCPPNAFDLTGKVCGTAQGQCDVPARCQGDSANCPSNSLKGLGVPCRPSSAACDVEEHCDGQTAQCPVDGFLGPAVNCRPMTGDCDLDEFCSGDAGQCPADSVAPITKGCRAAAGPCDRAETCTGASHDCPLDVQNCPAGAYCTAGGCVPKLDAGVTCSGDINCTSGFCSDAVCCNTACTGPCDGCDGPGAPGQCTIKGPGVVCRAAAGACDVAENCDGVGAACRADVLLANSVICRTDAGACDLVERCTGSSAACPIDSFLGSSVICRASAGVCDVVDLCPGVSAFCPDGFVGAGGTCRDAGILGPCDAPEACTGSIAQCPADGLFDAGTACGPVSCMGGQILAAPTCLSGGVCVPGSASSCLGYQCNGAGCFTTCTGSANCDSSHDCDAGQCVQRAGLGSPCPGGQTDCGVGTCTDGVCCASACNGPCEFCNVSGSCTPRPAGTDLEGGCGAFTCSGLGLCRASCAGEPACSSFCKSGNYCVADGGCSTLKAVGGTCTSNCECAGGACNDGFCCNRACGRVCESCAIMPGTCVNHTAGSDPELGCANFECNGAGACATTCGGGTCTSTACKPAAYCNGTTCLADKVDGLPCALACECASGVCASYYPDTDGDGQGNNSVSPTLYCGSAAPPGYTADNRDCCDTDNNAFVGQNMYFTSPRSTCGGGFDYNCVGGATSQYTAIQRCDNVGSNCLNRCTAAVTGWVGSAAACGATAAWGGCDYFEGCAPLQVCAATTTPMMQTQGCR